MATTQTLDFSLPITDNITWLDDPDNIARLIQSKAAWYSAQISEFFTTWQGSIFDLINASAFGCAVWAIILNVPVSLVYSGEPSAPPFGFGGGRGNFYFSNFNTTGWGGTLTLPEFKALLIMRYASQTMSPTVPNINAALKLAFGGMGVSFVRSDDTLTPMTQQYVFQFVMSTVLKDALVELEILPRGCGVSNTIVSL